MSGRGGNILDFHAGLPENWLKNKQTMKTCNQIQNNGGIIAGKFVILQMHTSDIDLGNNRLA